MAILKRDCPTIICGQTIDCSVNLTLTCGGLVYQLLDTTIVVSNGGSQTQTAHGGKRIMTGAGVGVQHVMRIIAAAWKNQADHEIWEEYAASIAGLWVLCAHNTGKTPGQKIFTQVNWLRLQTQQGLALTPDDLGNPPDSLSVDLEIVWNGDHGEDYANVFNNGGSEDLWINMRQGKGTKNNLLFVGPTTGHIAAGTEDYEKIFATGVSMGYPGGEESFFAEGTACAWSENGAPGPIVPVTFTSIIGSGS